MRDMLSGIMKIHKASLLALLIVASGWFPLFQVAAQAPPLVRSLSVGQNLLRQRSDTAKRRDDTVDRMLLFIRRPQRHRNVLKSTCRSGRRRKRTRGVHDQRHV